MNKRLDSLLRRLDEAVDPGWFPQNLARKTETGQLFAFLANLVSITEAIERLRPDSAVKQVSPANQIALARKVLLGRHDDLFQRLTGFWVAGGTPESVVEDASRAVKLCLAGWPGQVVDLRPPTAATGLPFKSSYADFVADLAAIEQCDGSGRLGEAVRASRYTGADRRTARKPCLPGESKLPIGFPVLLCHGENSKPVFLCSEAWVEPAVEWPKWLTERFVPQLDQAKTRWQELVKRVDTALQEAGYDTESQAGVLPEWLLLYIARYGVDTLDSAGLALALQTLASHQKGPLPAGVGFTGKWDERGRLAPVSGIGRKLRAAREAGIFALFACAGPYELPAEADVTGGGVDLYLLPEELDLAEVVRLVNTACAARGLTEDRWRWVSKQQQAFLQPEEENPGVASRLLPNAANERACPVGFVGRDQELEKLTEEKRLANNQAGRRRLVILEGSLRAGKTTLLSYWLREKVGPRFPQWYIAFRATAAGQKDGREEVGPRFPLWYSFLRDDPFASSRERFAKAFDQQLQARFRLLLLPGNFSSNQPKNENWPSLTRAVIEATHAAIDFAVDGMDEARPEDQRDILTLLRMLPGSGFAVIGVQMDTPCLEKFDEAQRVRLGTTGEDWSTAKKLIHLFGKELLKKNDELARFGDEIMSARGVQALIRHTYANLWMLTDFLNSILQGNDNPPASLEDLPPIDNAEKYYRHVRDQVLHSYDTGRAEAEEFLRTIAVLGTGDKQTWRVTAITRLTQGGLTDLKARELLRGHLRRLLASDNARELVRFKDSACRKILAKHYADTGREVAIRVVSFIGATEQADSILGAVVDHAARLVLEYAGDTPSLAARLLLDTTWVRQRLERLAQRKQPLEFLQYELSQLADRLDTSPRRREGAWVRRLRDALAGWRPAMEENFVSPAMWWPLFTPVRNKEVPQQLLGSPVPEHQAPEAECLLFAPPDGYGPISQQAMRLSGEACGMGGSTDRIVLVGTDERLYVYRRDGSQHRPERVIRIPHGPILQIESLNERQVLVVASSSLQIVDVTESHTPITLRIGRDLLGCSIISSKDNLRWLVRACAHGEGSELRVYRLDLSRVDHRSASVVECLVDVGPPLVLPFRVSSLQRMAEDTYAVWGHTNHDKAPINWRHFLAVHQWSGDRIQDQTSPDVAKAIQDGTINGACLIPKGCLAVVVSIQSSPSQVVLLVVAPNGTLDGRIRLDQATPEETLTTRVQRYDMRPRPQPVSRPPSYFNLRNLWPLGWHAHYGLLARPYYALSLAPESLPQPLPENLAEEFGEELKGARSLSDGRVLLVFSTVAAIPSSSWAVILGPGPMTNSIVEGLPPGSKSLGVRADGVLVACDEFWDEFYGASRYGYRYLSPLEDSIIPIPDNVNFHSIGDKGIVAFSRGSHAVQANPRGHRDGYISTGTFFRGSQVWGHSGTEEFLIWDGLYGNSQGLEILHALVLDKQQWAAAAWLYTMPADDTEPLLAQSKHPRQHWLLLATGIGNKVHKVKFEVDAPPTCQIEGLANGIVAFRVGDTNDEPQWTRVHLYDFVADNVIRDDEVEFEAPLLALSLAWIVFLGPASEEGQAQKDPLHSIYQYRAGSPDSRALIQDFFLAKHLYLLNRSDGQAGSAGLADILEIQRCHGQTFVRVHQLEIDVEFGVQLSGQPPLEIALGDQVVDDGVAVIGLQHLAVAFASGRVEVVKLPVTANHRKKQVLAVGFVAELPCQVMACRWHERWHLAVTTASGVTWFDLSDVKQLIGG